MLKVMTIVGTRPEIIRLSRIIPKLDANCHHVLVHTGQNFDYELNQVFFEELGIRPPDIFLSSAGGSAAETIANVISSSDKVIEEERPDAVLILGDTNSSLSAIPAKRRKVPIFHMEAGNRCFDSRVPEEINRRIVDHVADINLTYSHIAREYLLREGLPPQQVIWTGSPLREVLDFYQERINRSQVLQKLELTAGRYFLVSAHREENVDSDQNLRKLFGVLDQLAATRELPVIVSTHPRTAKRIAALGMLAHPLVHFHKPFGYLDYIHLQMKAKAVLSDSGTITEESSILDFPALNLRETHERPEGFEEGAVILTGLDPEHVLTALAVLEQQPGGGERRTRMVADYAPGNVSEKVLRILLSYTPYVNRVTWKKP